MVKLIIIKSYLLYTITKWRTTDNTTDWYIFIQYEKPCLMYVPERLMFFRLLLPFF